MQDETQFGKGAMLDDVDDRDYPYEPIAAASEPFDWEKGYDIEADLNFELPIKNQWSSLSCVGQAFSYYSAVLNLIETGQYDEQSAKAIYSQIALAGGGAQFRSGAALLVNFGALLESAVKSLKPNGKTDESFMIDKSWITPEITRMAKILAAKDYRNVKSFGMDIFAQAIRDNGGIVAGVIGNNNGTWMSNDPKHPLPSTPQNELWQHALYFGKAGTDKLGRFIATPGSWGPRNTDELHPDGWQKLREDWFEENGRWLFSPWTLVNKPNNLIIKNKNMAMIKQAGNSAVYLQAGEILIPFTNWEAFRSDFPDAKIIEVSAVEFSKFVVAKSNQITPKK